MWRGARQMRRINHDMLSKTSYVYSDDNRCMHRFANFVALCVRYTVKSPTTKSCLGQEGRVASRAQEKNIIFMTPLIRTYDCTTHTVICMLP